jgi:hypothetical protein
MSIVSTKVMIAHGADLKWGSIRAGAREGFRKNRKEFCSHPPGVSVFDLNEATDEILARLCTDNTKPDGKK